jgi:hypothetical protein
MQTNDSTIPLGLCQCGCGQATKVATRTRRARGDFKGQPQRYVLGHNSVMPSETRRCYRCKQNLPREHFNQVVKLNGHYGGVSHHCRNCQAAFRDRNSLAAVTDDFWASVDQSGGPDACWPWLKGRTQDGYGSFRWTDTLDGERLAHRIACLLTKGPIPDGMEACHSCDNPPCCNPVQLFLGTNAENVADRVAKGRTRAGNRWERRDRHLSARPRADEAHS